MSGPYEEVVILCYRTSNPNALLVAGAAKTKCQKCQYEVWIAPSSVKILLKMKAKVMCDQCYNPKADPHTDILPLNNEQIGEIKDAKWADKNRN